MKERFSYLTSYVFNVKLNFLLFFTTSDNTLYPAAAFPKASTQICLRYA